MGSVAGFFALIPFRCWKPIHARHHKWTGWQDLDPTTAALVPRPLGRAERFAVNVCWRYWIPIFSVLYRAGNFWNLVRLFRLTGPQPGPARAMAVEAAALAAGYAAVVAALGPAPFVRAAGLALLLSLALEDVILLSQHTHMPMGLSRGREVQPHGALDQGSFTRSLRFPAWLSTMLLHFDAHELHHLYPAIPGYRLPKIRRAVGNEVGWREWGAGRARAVPARCFLFQNRTSRGSTCDRHHPRSRDVRRFLGDRLHAVRPRPYRVVAAPLSRRFAVPSTAAASWTGGRSSARTKTVRGFLVMVPRHGAAFLLLAALVAVGPGLSAAGLCPLTAGS